jgi:hypothetical protein
MSSDWFESDDSDVLLFGGKPVGGTGDVLLFGGNGMSGGIPVEDVTLFGGGVGGGTDPGNLPGMQMSDHWPPPDYF